jgi:tetratricopeptide (TPR) repeat protein
MYNDQLELCLKANAKACVIHFSSRGNKLGKFDRYPTPLDVSNIYINPSNTDWYVDGLSSLGNTLENSIDYLNDIINSNGIEQVVCIGSAMGAFGAALFASRLNCQSICFEPELSLGILGGVSTQDNVLSRDFFATFQPNRCLLVAGAGCPTDVLISKYYQQEWANSELFILARTGSEIAHFLTIEEKLAKLISFFIAGKSIDFLGEYTINHPKLDEVIFTPEKITLGAINTYYSRFNKHILSTQKLKLAAHYTNRNHYPIADNILVHFIDEYGPLSEAIFLLAKLRRKMKNNVEALSLFKQLENNPEYKLQGLWGQSMIHQKAGDIDEANRLYMLIIKGADSLAIVKESKKWLVKNQEPVFEKAPNKNLILTTFPAHKSNNVGDSMIANSALAMIKSRYTEFDAFTLFREVKLDKYEDGTVVNIIAPGFSVSNNVYPELFSLYSDLNRLPSFFPIGCSFQHPIASQRVFDEYEYNSETLHFLKLIAEKSGPLPCRDQLIVDLLLRHNIPAVYSGDLVLFDEKHVNTKFTPIQSIKSVVFTIQHHPKYQEQSFLVIGLIKKLFPTAELFVAFHSKESAYSRVIADFAIQLGYKELHLYGEYTNLNIYDDIDFHIGYRLHGHISFLRRRKASVLLVEDARAYGFSRTIGTSTGCVDALDERSELPRTDICDELSNLVQSYIDSNFYEFIKVFEFIDLTFKDVILSYFEDMVRHISKN